VFTRVDGIVLDTFFVTDARTGGFVPPAAREKFESFLRRALTEDLDLHPLLAKQSTVRPLYQPVAGGQLPTRVHFDNDSSEARTILEIETEDRVGLLYVISQALTECRLDISVAKITTEKGAAIDAFYVAEADGQKVTEPGRQVFIKQQLQTAIGSLAKG
jgi:[protein-PII] uridylyltransferase